MTLTQSLAETLTSTQLPQLNLAQANQWLEWLRDPERLLWHLLDVYGVWMLAFVALIVFIESGVLSLCCRGIRCSLRWGCCIRR